MEPPLLEILATPLWIPLTMPNGALANPIVIYQALLECNVDTVAQQVLIVHVHLHIFSPTYSWTDLQLIFET